MSIWVTGKVISIQHWTDRLFTVCIRASVNTFVAGQFARIGMHINNVVVQRAYSYLNSPSDVDLEFYITTIPGGRLTPYLQSLHSGDSVMITKESYGRFILNEIPQCENLWMLATGTGISPYLSMLEYHDQKLNMFSNIILVYATRFSKNLNYLFKMKNLQKIYCNRLHVQTVLSQEKSISSLYGRIPMLIENNVLEEAIGCGLDAQNSHVMLCGNPEMICDTKRVLKRKYGMQDHRKRFPGHITQERYW